MRQRRWSALPASPAPHRGSVSVGLGAACWPPEGVLPPTAPCNNSGADHVEAEEHDRIREAGKQVVTCYTGCMTPRQVHATAGFFGLLATSKYCSLTTYKRDGTPVATPVNVVVNGDVAYFRTWNTSGKAKRLRHTPRVELQPSGPRGKPKSNAKLSADATLLAGEESHEAAAALAHQHPLVHGLVVPRLHRLRGWATQQYRLDPPRARPSGRSPERA
jgi:uncharacterized protein